MRNQNKLKSFKRLTELSEEFAKIGINMQFPKICGAELKKKLIEKWQLNNLEEQWERQKLLKKL